MLIWRNSLKNMVSGLWYLKLNKLNSLTATQGMVEVCDMSAGPCRSRSDLAASINWGESFSWVSFK